MIYRIGVFGAASEVRPELAEPARRIGRGIAARGAAVITGGCSGLPYLAAEAAAGAGAEVWGFSPVRNLEEQRRFVPDDDLSIYARLVYVPEELPFAGDLNLSKKYRNIISTSTCDAGIIISGRWGTLNEFTNLVDFGKVIGVLAGSGNIADMLPELAAAINAEPHPRIIIDDNPERLVEKTVRALNVEGTEGSY